MEVAGGNVESKHYRHRKKQLFSNILRQMEFYFSDANLAKDRFFSELMRDNQYVELTLFLNCNKIKNLTTNVGDIQKSIKGSDFIELSEDKTKVRRKTPISRKINVDDCTIYVERLPSDAEHNWVQKLFAQFGKVDYISMPKYKHNKLIKGFAFIEFDRADSADKALKYFETIGCKLPSKMAPDQLCSIKTFEGENDDKNKQLDAVDDAENKNKEAICYEKRASDGEERNDGTQRTLDTEESENDEPNVKKSNANESSNAKIVGVKRRLSSDDEKVENESHPKIIKLCDDNDGKIGNKFIEHIEATDVAECDEANLPTDSTDEATDLLKKKRKRKKPNKQKQDIKEIGLQALSKKEWKKMRNKYLDLQKSKMRKLKQHLNYTRFSKNTYKEGKPALPDENGSNKDDAVKKAASKIQYKPGLIVHVKFSEPMVEDDKKMKAKMKTHSTDIQYIEIPSDMQNMYIRFADKEEAEKFCNSESTPEGTILQGTAEEEYWKKIMDDRNKKNIKNEVKSKQRGRDKLLKKAEKELGKHIRFTDDDE